MCSLGHINLISKPTRRLKGSGYVALPDKQVAGAARIGIVFYKRTDWLTISAISEDSKVYIRACICSIDVFRQASRYAALFCSYPYKPTIAAIASSSRTSLVKVEFATSILPTTTVSTTVGQSEVGRMDAQNRSASQHAQLVCAV